MLEICVILDMALISNNDTVKIVYPKVIEIDHGKVSYVGDHTQYEKESQFYKTFLENLAEKTEDGDTMGEEIPVKESLADRVSN